MFSPQSSFHLYFEFQMIPILPQKAQAPWRCCRGGGTSGNGLVCPWLQNPGSPPPWSPGCCWGIQSCRDVRGLTPDLREEQEGGEGQEGWRGQERPEQRRGYKEAPCVWGAMEKEPSSPARCFSAWVVDAPSASGTEQGSLLPWQKSHASVLTDAWVSFLFFFILEYSCSVV